MEILTSDEIQKLRVIALSTAFSIRRDYETSYDLVHNAKSLYEFLSGAKNGTV